MGAIKTKEQEEEHVDVRAKASIPHGASMVFSKPRIRSRCQSTRSFNVEGKKSFYRAPILPSEYQQQGKIQSLEAYNATKSKSKEVKRRTVLGHYSGLDIYHLPGP
jgi:hypothetical protein